MQFATKEDIEAPIDHVFARITDATSFERAALRRGMDVARVDRMTTVGTGSQWQTAFQFRGKQRDAEIKVAQFEPPQAVQVLFETGGIEGISQIELVALSRSRTRLSVTVDLKPRSISARLLLQSLKLAKSSLTAKFKGRVASMAEDIEEKYRAGV